MAIVFEREGMGIPGEWEARGVAQIPFPSNACQQGRLEFVGVSHASNADTRSKRFVTRSYLRSWGGGDCVTSQKNVWVGSSISQAPLPDALVIMC